MAPRTNAPTRRPRRALLLGLVVPVLLLAVACDPVTHPDRVVVDPATSLGVVGLSGDGNFVVVSATAPSDTVPGPGLWRIDRRDGTATALPASTFVRISHDGQRLLLDPGTGTRVWRDGAFAVGAPNHVPTSHDLRFAIYPGILDPRLMRVDLATGVRTPFGPAGVTARDIGISDDGSTAWYESDPSVGPCRTTFVEIATGATTVHDVCGRVSGSGRHLLVELDVEMVDGIFFTVGGPRRLQLFASASPGVVLTEVVASPDTLFAEVHVAAELPVVWATEVYASGNITEPCGTPFSPPCTFEERTVAIVAATAQGSTRTTSPGNFATLIQGEPRQTTITPSGRFLVHTFEGRVRIYDRHGPRTEVLAGDAVQRSPHLSADGRLVVVGEQPATPGGGWGWYERREAPADGT